MMYMKKFTAHAFIVTKIITLFCMSNMGLLSLGEIVHAQMPCHQQVATETENCNACIESLNAWTQDYVQEELNQHAPTIYTLAMLPPSHDLVDFKNTANYKFFSYIPPPHVVYINAFNLAHNSIVIIT